jgi:pSer/pThr/pTyr-binding forkhead associated (FHA) protein
MQRTGAEQPVFIGQSGPLNGERFMIGRDLTIGRDPSCDIVIPDRQVSRFHARLIPGPNGVKMEDLGSKNGTYINGKKLEDPQYLQDGDLIQVALVQSFVFLSSDATMPIEGLMPAQRERFGRLYLDNRSRRVWIGKQEVVPPLSAPQFRLLQLLYDQQGKVVSRSELVSVVWSDEEAEGVSDQALDALVRRLRDRLAMIDPSHTYLVTVRGHGLRLDNPPE